MSLHPRTHSRNPMQVHTHTQRSISPMSLARLCFLFTSLPLSSFFLFLCLCLFYNLYWNENRRCLVGQLTDFTVECVLFYTMMTIIEEIKELHQTNWFFTETIAHACVNTVPTTINNRVHSVRSVFFCFCIFFLFSLCYLFKSQKRNFCTAKSIYIIEVLGK